MDPKVLRTVFLEKPVDDELKEISLKYSISVNDLIKSAVKMLLKEYSKNTPSEERK
jgi:hypothetical protein